MEKQCFINNKSLSYFDIGEGPVLVLIHGYLETKEVWKNFANKLSEKYRVIALDIPGHGQSDLIAETHTMNLMAETIYALLQELNIDTCTLVGHSMGGYVMLAFAQLYYEKLEKLILFHSSVYADTDEKKKNRQREIEFIQQGKLELIVNSNLPNTFANDNLEIFSNQIETLKTHAKTNNANGVCALLRGMMVREDMQNFIRAFKKPMLFIFGEKDNYIPVEIGKQMLDLNSSIQVKWLNNSGHMGFIEQESDALASISNFA